MGKIAFFLRGVHIGVLRVPPRPQRFFMEFQVLPNIRIVEAYPAVQLGPTKTAEKPFYEAKQVTFVSHKSP